MSAFTEDEINYLVDQPLGRLATVGPKGQPHVVPVGFRYHADCDTIRISGHDFNETKKFKDAENHPKVAFVVDDLASVEPWHPRGSRSGDGRRRSEKEEIKQAQAPVTRG